MGEKQSTTQKDPSRCYDEAFIGILIQQIFSCISQKFGASFEVYDFFIPEEKNEILSEEATRLQGFRVHTTGGTYLGILAPEYTLPAVQRMHKSSGHVYYIQSCFRNETKQYLRDNVFTQVGIEFVAHNSAKGRIASLICLKNLEIFLKVLGLKYELLIDCADKQMTEALLQCLDTSCIKIQEIKRDGNDLNQYTELKFEIMGEVKANSQKELVGGGSYCHKGKSLFNTGYAGGTKRLQRAIEHQNKDIDELLASFAKLAGPQGNRNIVLRSKETDLVEIAKILSSSISVESVMENKLNIIII